MDSTPRQLAVIHSYAELLQALRARRDELDISNETIDELAGTTPCHAAKLLALNPKKFLGPVGWNIIQAMGLAVVIVEDEAALACSQSRAVWQKKGQQPQELPHHDYPNAAA